MQIQFDNYLLQPLSTADVTPYFNLIKNNQSRLEDFFPGTVLANQTLAQSQAYCLEIAKKQEAKTYFPFVICEKTTLNYVSIIDVKHIDWKIPKAEIGYFIDQQYEGRGIISKALRQLLAYLIQEHNFKKLLMRIGTKNSGSKKVALKSGFQLEGCIRRDFRTSRGELVDLEYYGLLC